jgi:hypothetical protein
MSRKKPIYFTFAIAITFFTVALQCQSTFISVEEIKPGMKGEAYTVLKGSTVEKLPMEVVGVLENSLGPKMDMVVIRLLGDKAKQFGTIAGMSGSPIYIDGKLMGAISYRIGTFAQDPLAGVTPIKYMLKLKENGGKSGSGTFASVCYQNLYPLHPLEGVLKTAQEKALKRTNANAGNDNFKPIETPLGFAGFHPKVIDNFSHLFKQLGFITSQAGSSTISDDNPLEPGSSVSAQLVRGDISISANGTVTHISNNDILAFGHPFFQIGKCEIPLTKAQVLTIFPSLYTSFKITTSLEVVGTIVQDQYTGIFAILGKKPTLIPVNLELKNGRDLIDNFKFEMVSDRLLSPFLLNISVMNAIYSHEQAIGDSTLQIRGKIKIKQKPEVNISNIFTGDTAIDTVSRYIAAVLYYLKDNPFQYIDVEKIDLSVEYNDKRKVANIERAWFDKDEVKRGEKLTLFVLIKPFREKPILKNFDLRIPPSISPGKINVLVADAITINKEESKLFQGKFLPKDLDHLIALLNNIRSNYKIYADFSREEGGMIVKGQFMPAIPPSLLSVFNEQQTPGELIKLNYNLLSEEKIDTEYFISGSKKLSLVIKE